MALVLAGCDLLAWLKVLGLDGALAGSSPRPCATACSTSVPVSFGWAEVVLRLARNWPWTHELAGAYLRLAAITRAPHSGSVHRRTAWIPGLRGGVPWSRSIGLAALVPGGSARSTIAIA